MIRGKSIWLAFSQLVTDLDGREFHVEKEMFVLMQ